MQVTDHGSIVSFQPANEQEYSWMQDNLQTESWQWLGRNLNVDHRFADDIIALMQEEGLALE